MALCCPERTRFVQVDLQKKSVGRERGSHPYEFVCHSCQQVGPGYLVEPEIVRLKKSLKLGVKLVIVESVDGLHVTITVIQVTCDLLMDSKHKQPVVFNSKALHGNEKVELILIFLLVSPETVLHLFCQELFFAK